MATRRPPRPGANPTPKRREDNFWYVVMVLAIVSFTLSFWLFYALTSRVNTKTPTVAGQPSAEASVAAATPDPSNSETPTLLIGEGQGASPSPAVGISPSPLASASPLTGVLPTPAASPSLQGIITMSTPSPLRSQAPNRLAATPRPDPDGFREITPTPKPDARTADKGGDKGGDVVFRVQVGSYAEREEAAKAAEELAGMGYSVVMIGDGDKTRIQLGSFNEQDKALKLAEEITAKGYSVVVRRTPR